MSLSAIERNALPKAYAAITTGGYVLFAFMAHDRADAENTLRALRHRSDTILSFRKLRGVDMGVCGGPLVWRGSK